MHICTHYRGGTGEVLQFTNLGCNSKHVVTAAANTCICGCQRMHTHAHACMRMMHACICMHTHAYACIRVHQVTAPLERLPPTGRTCITRLRMHAYTCMRMCLHAHTCICMHQVTAPRERLPPSVRNLPEGTDIMVTFATGLVSNMDTNWVYIAYMHAHVCTRAYR